MRSMKSKKVAGAITSIGSTSSMDDKFQVTNSRPNTKGTVQSQVINRGQTSIKGQQMVRKVTNNISSNPQKLSQVRQHEGDNSNFLNSERSSIQNPNKIEKHRASNNSQSTHQHHKNQEKQNISYTHMFHNTEDNR